MSMKTDRQYQDRTQEDRNDLHHSEKTETDQQIDVRRFTVAFTAIHDEKNDDSLEMQFIFPRRGKKQTNEIFNDPVS